MYRVTIVHNATEYHTRAVDPASIAHFDRRDRVNVVHWPAGAQNYGSCVVMMLQADLDALYAAIGSNIMQAVTLRFGDGVNESIEFSRMYAMPPEPVLVSEGSGAVYAVEFVDDRYFWRSIDQTTKGYNATLDDKESLYDATEDTGPAAWTYAGVVGDLVDALTAWTPLAQFDVTDSISSMSSSIGLRDLMTQHANAAVTLDRVLAVCGYVLVAKSKPDANGKRYVLAPLQSGDAAAKSFLSARTDDLLAGGIVTYQGDTSGVIGAASVAFGTKAQIAAAVPSQIRVMFPIAQDNGEGYSFDEAVTNETGYVPTRWYSVTSTSGRPTAHSGNEAVVYDCQWAVYAATTLQNSSELNTRAGVVAAIYYSRFLAGIGDMWFRGVHNLTPWAGAQVVEWSLGPRGPMTRIRGDFDSPLFGWRRGHTDALTAQDIVSVGSVRAMPRPWGGVLLDSPAGDEGGFWGIVDGTASAVTSIKWTYPVVEGQYNASNVLVAKSGGRSVTAYNAHEENATASYENIDCTGVSTDPPPGQMHRRPFPDGAKIGWVRPTVNASGDTIWVFDKVNPMCPDCEPPA